MAARAPAHIIRANAGRVELCESDLLAKLHHGWWFFTPGRLRSGRVRKA
jgi:hypothetical protein